MVTRSESASTARSKNTTRGSGSSRGSSSRGSGLKTRKTKHAARSSRAQVAKPAASRKTPAKPKPAGTGQRALRDKKLLEIFGATTPRGKLQAADGSLVSMSSAASGEVCVMAFAPRSDRMHWIYLSHGLCEAPQKVELAICWKPRENHSPVDTLHKILKYAANGAPLTPGQVVSGGPGDAELDFASSGYQHWLVTSPENALPDTLDLPGVKAKVLMLVGITDAELQLALKVKPEIADGRKVLLAALKTSGVFPISDAGRACMTRRRDFNRIWETAFRIVRGE